VSFEMPPQRKGGYSREKLALSLPKGWNPVRKERIAENRRSGFPSADGNDRNFHRPCLANDTTTGIFLVNMHFTCKRIQCAMAGGSLQVPI